MKGEKLILKGKPFNCECGCAFFVFVTDKDAWECVTCERIYHRTDGTLLSNPLEKGQDAQGGQGGTGIL